MRLRRAAAFALLLASCRSDPAAPRVPPPAVRPPQPPDVVAAAEAQGRDELARWQRERDERFIEAIDPGEAAEHARAIPLAALESGSVPLADVFRQGEAIFERRFTVAEGLGAALSGRPRPSLSRVEGPGAGGPDALSCKDCHGRGGDDGHGELHQRAWIGGDGRHLRTATPRVPPHLGGLGLVERLAAEISADLTRQIEIGRAVAKAGAAPQVVRLSSKGVEFGAATVGPDGAVDPAGARGVDRDWIVRPFGWKGVTATLREFARRALPQHLGLEPLPIAIAAAGGAPALRGEDGDRDGVPLEITEGQLSALAAYLALLDTPVTLPPRAPEAARAFVRGGETFRAIGCAECHRPSLPLRSAALVVRAPGGGRGLALDLVKDNQQPPALEQFDYSRESAVPLYSDLRRHDLGPGLAERTEPPDAPAASALPPIAATAFLTRPLWGIADRACFLHDGRARSLRAAILAHGGEAQAAADAYAKLPLDEARAIDVFLLALRRAPQGRIVP